MVNATKSLQKKFISFFSFIDKLIIIFLFKWKSLLVRPVEQLIKLKLPYKKLEPDTKNLRNLRARICLTEYVWTVRDSKADFQVTFSAECWGTVVSHKKWV